MVKRGETELSYPERENKNSETSYFHCKRLRRCGKSSGAMLTEGADESIVRINVTTFSWALTAFSSGSMMNMYFFAAREKAAFGAPRLGI